MIKVYAMIALAIASFGAGWQFNSYKEDSIRLAEKEATEKAVRIFVDNESKVAGIVADKLKRLRANERIIERHTQKVIDRPVYRNICIDDDGLHIINNSYALGNTAELIGEMSRNATAGSGQDR